MNLPKFVQDVLCRIGFGALKDNEYCQRCGALQVIDWWCEDDTLWRDISGSNDHKILCPLCFTRAAEALHYHVHWYPEVESFPEDPR